MPVLLPCWFPAVRRDDEGPPTGSRVGGRPWLPEGTAHPRCDVCGEPLTLLVQLDRRTLPREAADGLVQAFFCEAHSGGGAGPDLSTGLARVVAAGPGARSDEPARGTACTIVGWSDARVDLPWPRRMDELARGRDLDEILDPDELAAFGEAYGCPDFDAFEAGFQLGGWPQFRSDTGAPPPCRTCGRPTSALFQVESLAASWSWSHERRAIVLACDEHADDVHLVLGW